MAEDREEEIRRLMEIAARAGEQERVAEWLRTHPDARTLPWILIDPASGRARVCFPAETRPERRGRPKKNPP